MPVAPEETRKPKPSELIREQLANPNFIEDQDCYLKYIGSGKYSGCAVGMIVVGLGLKEMWMNKNVPAITMFSYLTDMLDIPEDAECEMPSYIGSVNRSDLLATMSVSHSAGNTAASLAESLEAVGL